MYINRSFFLLWFTDDARIAETPERRQTLFITVKEDRFTAVERDVLDDRLLLRGTDRTQTVPHGGPVVCQLDTCCQCALLTTGLLTVNVEDLWHFFTETQSSFQYMDTDKQLRRTTLWIHFHTRTAVLSLDQELSYSRDSARRRSLRRSRSFKVIDVDTNRYAPYATSY